MTPRILFVFILGLANLILFLPPLRPLAAVLLTLILPGWGWTTFFLLKNSPPGKPILSLAFSFTITTLTILGLHYLPGPIRISHLLIALNIIAILPLIRSDNEPAPEIVQTEVGLSATSPVAGAKQALDSLQRPSSTKRSSLISNLQSLVSQSPLPYLRSLIFHPLTPIILIALFLRFANLSYSEFQGDEALAMIFAAEAIEGHQDALFLRGKGPGEILLPLAIWRIAGPITEQSARIPFAMAGSAGVVTLYLLARAFFSQRVALYSAGFFAASGFMVAFSRIVQYQAIVIWMSALALWTLWQWRQSRRRRWAFISGLFTGIGLLAHYDAILILPVLAWLLLKGNAEGRRQKAEHSTHLPISNLERTAGRLTSSLLWLTGCLSSALPFYVPYLLDPQIRNTGSYLGDRIGEGGLNNHLGAFLHFNSFYSSFYYTLLMGLLLVGFVAWALHRSRWSRGWGPPVAVAGLVGLAAWPDTLGKWTAIPFGLILLAAFLSTGLATPHRLALIWFAVPFLGYNFAVARPLTHIYTIVPGWALLAGWMMGKIRPRRVLGTGINIALMLIFTGYLGQVFVRHDLLFLQDYPEGNPAFYWTPYTERPETGFFGFPHNTGWKAVGALLADGTLSGDYDSNEEEEISSWYTRHSPRACDPGAEFYFIASDLLDEMPLPGDLLANSYQMVGQTKLPTGKTLTIQQRSPTTLNLGALDGDQLARQFDRSAFPAAFTRKPRWLIDDGTNFGGEIQLLGYNLDTGRAYPGGRILLTLFWQILKPVDNSYKVFVQFDPERKFAQADSFPVCSRYPTNLWRPGQIIADHHALHLSPDTPATSIPLAVGLYLPQDGRRLDILDVAGNPAGVSLILTNVQVTQGKAEGGRQKAE